jgi:hypothetical protein
MPYVSAGANDPKLLPELLPADAVHVVRERVQRRQGEEADPDAAAVLSTLKATAQARWSAGADRPPVRGSRAA